MIESSRLGDQCTGVTRLGTPSAGLCAERPAWFSATPAPCRMSNFDSEFQKLFQLAQQRFGPCEPGWIVDSVLVQGSNFPETTSDLNSHRVLVRITDSARLDSQRRTYQLAHEAVHCLSPRGRRDTLFFEEGLANWFAITLPLLSRQYRKACASSLPKILRGPYEAFCELKPADEQIRALRNDQLVLDDVTPGQIEKHFGARPGLATKLCQRMGLGRPEAM
jgi:hypothetical protein